MFSFIKLLLINVVLRPDSLDMAWIYNMSDGLDTQCQMAWIHSVRWLG